MSAAAGARWRPGRPAQAGSIPGARATGPWRGSRGLGWRPGLDLGPGGTPPDLSLSWRARDSAGRWHLVSGMSWGAPAQTRGMIKMYLTPPLHPAATALDVFVTGPRHQVQATVPLRWARGAIPAASPGRPAVFRIPRQ